MKNKYIVGVLVIAGIIAIGIGGTIYGVNNTKINNKLGSKVVKSNESVPKKVTTNKIEKPNTLPKAIIEIDKTNYDTYKWWNASNEELLAQLSREAKEYKDSQIQSIVDNAANIPSYLVRLAVMHPESIPYVAGYTTRKLNQPINIDNYYTPGKIPLFQQWDKQWGYDFYGEGPLATDGCGPTALAMVVVGLTGDTSVNPKVVADYSVAHGGYIDDEGTSWCLMTSLATHFGVEGTRISENQVISQLKEGHPVIVSMGPGQFTLTGHFMVLTGVTADGKITLNDPDSIKYSQETWNFNQITSSARAYWSYTKIN